MNSVKLGAGFFLFFVVASVLLKTTNTEFSIGSGMMTGAIATVIFVALMRVIGK
jgi:hypothetical protein